ncbi:hypothetical protein JCM8097_007107 [Rhodosporidiobolus ruineniae]
MVSTRTPLLATPPRAPAASDSKTAPTSSIPSLPPQKAYPPPPLAPHHSYIRDAPGSASGGVGSSGRRLVLFFDGTGNQFGSTITNIPTLFSLSSEDPSKQLCYYQTGIGTSISTHESPFAPSKIMNRLGQIVDTGVAWSLPSHIQKGYQFLMNHYQPGDAIFLFGFSRGAFTARALAGMLQQVGLLPAGNEETVPLAYSIYKKTTDTQLTPTETLAEGFKRTFSRSVEVEFVGVFDTVSSVGALWPRTLPFAAGSKSIHHFRQAFALDERRARYAPQPWIPDPSDEATIKEVWFVGSHSNVGGGEFPYDGDASPSLSHLPLRWMLREAVECGLELDSARVASSPLYSLYWQRARDAVEGKKPDDEGGSEEDDVVAEGLRSFLKTTRAHNPDVNPVVAACVYLASLPSARAKGDALAPRANHLGLRLEKRPAAVRKKQGFAARFADWTSRVSQRAVTLGWWLLEVSPTPKIVWDVEGKTRRWKLRSNFGRGRLLTPSPSFHYSVASRLAASAADFAKVGGNNENTPEGEGYEHGATFRKGEGVGDVEWVE